MTENEVPAPGHAPTLALKVAVALGLLADLALVVVLLLASTMVFKGPEGADSAGAAIVGWGMTLAVCILSPLLALPMWRRGRRDLALAMIWLPVIALLVGVAIGSL